MFRSLAQLPGARLPRLARLPSSTAALPAFLRPAPSKAVVVDKQITAPTGPAAERSPSGVIELERQLNKLLVDSVVFIIDSLYEERPYARFYVLETIARVPYFSFTSILHLYESFGWWRRSDYLKIHFAQARSVTTYNEAHHLLIMETLGGNERWIDRAIAQHIAFFCANPLVSNLVDCLTHVHLRRPPDYWMTGAYNLMEQIEEHAFTSYDNFLVSDGERLATQAAPQVAIDYYTPAGGDMYLFDELQDPSQPVGSRRPAMANLRDVFEAIRDDEGQHVSTMKACQTKGALRSPHDTAAAADRARADCEGVVECLADAATGWRVADSEEARKSVGANAK